MNQVLPSLEEPKLYRMWEVYQRYGRGAYSAGSERVRDTDPLKEEYLKLQKDYQGVFEEKEAAKDKLLESQANWTLFSKDILAISKELYKAIIAMKNRQKVPEELLATSKAQIDKYESFLNSNQVIFRESQSSEPTPRESSEVVSVPEAGRPREPSDASAAAPSQESSEPTRRRELPGAPTQLKSPSFGQQPLTGVEVPDALVECPAINYAKLKQFLLTSTDDLKVSAVLQALRWRITRNRKRSARLAIMSEYMREDLLSCNDNGYILQRLLEHPNRKVVEYTVSLLDELVAENIGTQYLTEQPKAMPLLAEILTREVCCCFLFSKNSAKKHTHRKLIRR